MQQNLHDTGPNTETSHSAHVDMIRKGICSFNVLCYIKGQKRGSMKRSEVFKKIIVGFILFIFVFKLKSSDLYRKICKSFM